MVLPGVIASVLIAEAGMGGWHLALWGGWASSLKIFACLACFSLITFRPHVVPGIFKRLEFPHDGLKLSFWLAFFLCYEAPA